LIRVKHLPDTVLLAGFDKSKLAGAFELFTISGVRVIELIEILGNYGFSEKTTALPLDLSGRISG
jgi:hypothetical protein